MPKVYVQHSDLMTMARFTAAMADIPEAAHPAIFRVHEAIARGMKRDSVEWRIVYGDKKINAIKAYRNITGSGLVEAKKDIEAEKWTKIPAKSLNRVKQLAAEAGVSIEFRTL